MNDIFHFVERPQFKKRLYIKKKTRSCRLSRHRESFFPCSQIAGSSTKFNKEFCFSQGIKKKKKKKKLILGHLTTVLVQYARNMLGELGEQDSFKSFHRFCNIGFVILLLDHLYVMFLICTSFSDIFPRNQAICTLFSFQRFSIFSVHVYMF